MAPEKKTCRPLGIEQAATMPSRPVREWIEEEFDVALYVHGPDAIVTAAELNFLNESQSDDSDDTDNIALRALGLAITVLAAARTLNYERRKPFLSTEDRAELHRLVLGIQQVVSGVEPVTETISILSGIQKARELRNEHRVKLAQARLKNDKRQELIVWTVNAHHRDSFPYAKPLPSDLVLEAYDAWNERGRGAEKWATAERLLRGAGVLEIPRDLKKTWQRHLKALKSRTAASPIDSA